MEWIFFPFVAGLWVFVFLIHDEVEKIRKLLEKKASQKEDE